MFIESLARQSPLIFLSLTEVDPYPQVSIIAYKKPSRPPPSLRSSSCPLQPTHIQSRLSKAKL